MKMFAEGCKLNYLPPREVGSITGEGRLGYTHNDGLCEMILR